MKQDRFVSKIIEGKTKKQAIEEIGSGGKELEEPIVTLTILDEMKKKQKMLLDGITHEKIEAAPLKDITAALATVTDKVRLQEGKSTQNIANMHNGKVLVEHQDDARIKQLLGRRIGVNELPGPSEDELGADLQDVEEQGDEDRIM